MGSSAAGTSGARAPETVPAGRAGPPSNGEPRRRPKDRKQQILAAAADRFRDRGYDQVGMAEVAEAVGIGPSALYRHFTGKRELLFGVLTDTLTRFENAVRAQPDLTGLVATLVRETLAHREFGLLWERESGHLPDAERRQVRRRLRALAATVAERLSAGSQVSPQEADLRAWAVLAVTNSPSHHRVHLDPDVFARVLVGATGAVCTAALPAGGSSAADARDRPGHAGLRPVSRREALVASAMRLFSDRGYPSVGMADIGAEAGITGASVYNHFDSKADLLVAVLTRGMEALWLGLHDALRRSDTPADALGHALADYVHFAARNPDSISVLVSEVVHLPDEHRHRFQRTRREYVGEWVALLRSARRGVDESEARILVHAALALANGLVRIHHLRRPDLAARVTALASAVLDSAAPTKAGDGR